MPIALALVDSHSHVQFPAYDQDRDEVMTRALDGGVGMISVGTQFSTSRDAAELAERYASGVLATAGFHPNHLDHDAHHDSQELRGRMQEIFEYEKFFTLVRHPKVVAIGECGLDYYRIRNQESGIMDRQYDVFCQQIGLAKEVGKPLIIHCRDAFHDLVPILDSCFKIHDSHPRGVIHFFSGTYEDACKLLDLGFYLGFGGVVTFARAYDEVVRKAPLDRLLIETDAPYVSPVPYRGRRNEPAYIVETARKIAEIRGIGYDEVAVQTLENTRKLFNL